MLQKRHQHIHNLEVKDFKRKPNFKTYSVQWVKKYILLQSKNPEYLLTFNCATKNSKGSHFCHNIFIKDYKGNIAKIQYEYMINLHNLCYLKDKCPNGKKSAQCLVYSSRLKAKGSALDQGYSFSQTE